MHRLGHRRLKSAAGMALLAGAILLTVPSTGAQFFDGLPLSSPWEVAALVVVAPFLVSGDLRRALAIPPVPTRWERVLVWTLPTAVVVKLLLGTTGLPAGFVSCARTPADPRPVPHCEASFENPFHRYASATRVDPVMDFGPGDWNYSFINSNRFNFYPWEPGHIARDRFPIAVTWHGEVTFARDTTVVVLYVGEGGVSMGHVSRTLRPRYGEVATERFRVPEGRHRLAVSYVYDDGFRTGNPAPEAPYATLRLLEEAHGSGLLKPVEASRPARFVRGLTIAVDVIQLLFLFWLAVGSWRFVKKDGWMCQSEIEMSPFLAK